MNKAFAIARACVLVIILQACSNLTTIPTSTVSVKTVTPLPSAPASTVTAIVPTPTPSGLTWERIALADEFKRDLVLALVIDPEDPKLLFVDTQHAGMFESDNGGMLWKPIQPDELSADQLAVLQKASSDTSHHVNVFSNVASDGIKRMYQYGPLKKDEASYWYVSEDSGSTWSRFSEGGTYSDFNPIAFDALGTVYVFCGRNICQFDPSGRPLKILGEPDLDGQSVITVSFKDPDTIYVAGNGIAVSKDGGLTWIKINNGLGSEILQLDEGLGTHPSLYLMAGECFAQTNNEGLEQPLYRSLDNGATWQLLTDKGCYLIKDADGNTLYRNAENTFFNYFYPYPKHRIWRSSNEGKSWFEAYAPIATNTLVADPEQSGVLFAYGIDSVQFTTKNYGDSWDKSLFISTRPCYGDAAQFIDKYRPTAIDASDHRHVLFISDGRLQESRDSCKTWSFVENQPPYPLNDVAIDPNHANILYVGGTSGAYISMDAGATWDQINNGLLNTAVVYSMVADTGSNVYAATPYGIFKLKNQE